MSVISADILNDPNKDNQFSALLDAVQRLDARVAELRATASLKSENLLDVTKKPQARRNIGIPDGDDTNNALTWDGSGWVAGSFASLLSLGSPQAMVGPSGSPQSITAGTVAIAFCIVGGGGGGAGADTSGTPQVPVSGGGGGGMYVIHRVGTATSWTYSIGAGGAGGTTGIAASSGSDGGDTSVTIDGVTYVAGGGEGGGTDTNGGNAGGGRAIASDYAVVQIPLMGGPGMQANVYVNSSGTTITNWSRGGEPPLAHAVAGSASVGGNGGFTGNNSFNGQAGSDGWIRFIEIS